MIKYVWKLSKEKSKDCSILGIIYLEKVTDNFKPSDSFDFLKTRDILLENYIGIYFGGWFYMNRK